MKASPRTPLPSGKLLPDAQKVTHRRIEVWVDREVTSFLQPGQPLRPADFICPHCGQRVTTAQPVGTVGDEEAVPTERTAVHILPLATREMPGEV